MFAYCNNNPVSYKDSSGAITIDAEQNGDIINVIIKDEGKLGPVHYVIVVEVEFNVLDAIELELGDYLLSLDSDGIEIAGPYGETLYYEYGDNYRQPRGIDVPLDPNTDSVYWSVSEDGVGIGVDFYEDGMTSCSVKVYPKPLKAVKEIVDNLPAAPTGGGYSSSGSFRGGFCGMNIPLRNPTSSLM